MALSEEDKKAYDKAQLELKTLQALIREKMQEQALSEREAAQARALDRAGKHEERTADADKEWDKLIETAQRSIEEGQVGYDNFSSAMGKVVANCIQLNKAIAASDPVGSLLIKADGLVTELVSSIQLNKRMQEASSYNAANFNSSKPSLDDVRKALDAAKLKAESLKVDMSDVRKKMQESEEVEEEDASSRFKP